MGMTGFLLCWPKREDHLTNIRMIEFKIKRWRHFQQCRESQGPVLRIAFRTCYNLNALCDLAMPDSNKISEAPRNAIYLYWQDKEASRRDQRWQRILTKFTILFQVSVLETQKTGFQHWLLDLLVLPLKIKSIKKRFHQGNSLLLLLLLRHFGIILVHRGRQCFLLLSYLLCCFSFLNKCVQ